MDRGFGAFVRRWTRPRRPLGTTYIGLVILTALGGIGGSATSAAMIFFRPFCEPLLQWLVIPILFRGKADYDYEPHDYYFFVGLVVVLTVMCILIGLDALICKPAEDRHLDETLRRRLRPHARGAPLDPP